MEDAAAGSFSERLFILPSDGAGEDFAEDRETRSRDVDEDSVAKPSIEIFEYVQISKHTPSYVNTRVL